MEKIKVSLHRVFEKREKTTRWNAVFRVGVILMALGIVLTISAIVFTCIANFEGVKIFILQPNDLSTYCGMGASLVALIGIFFLFCGKIEER